MAIDFDLTLIMVLGLFMVVLITMNVFVFGPFRKLFEARHEQLTGALERADAAIKEAEEKAATFKDKIQVASRKGMEARDEIRTEATKALNKRLEEERVKLKAKVEDSLKQIDSSKADALSKARSQGEDLAKLAAHKLLGRAL